MKERVEKLWRLVRENEYISYGVIGILLLFAGWNIYRTAHLFIPVKTKYLVMHEAIMQQPKQDIIDSINQVHIFGDPGISLEVGSGMKLIGIFINPSSQGSRVLIAVTGKVANSYKVGDILPNGTRVYQIFPDSVLLVENGKIIKLVFPLQGLEFSEVPPTGLF